MTRDPGQRDPRITAELDATSLETLLDVGERDPKPTTVMRRDELLDLVNATSAAPPVAVSAHAIPRALLEQRGRTPNYDLGSNVSPLVVLAIIGVLIAMFAAILLTN